MISLTSYTKLFRFNGSTYVEQQPDGTYKRIFKNLTKDDLCDHLEHRRVLAMYPSVAGKCQLGVIDLDIPHDLADDEAQWFALEEKIHTITDFMDDIGVESYLVEKTGGRGYHIWVFSELVESTQMYRFLRRVLEGVHIEGEVFPADTIEGGLGKAIRPIGGTHLKYPGSRSIAVDSKTLQPIELTEELITELLYNKIVVSFFNELGIENTEQSDFIKNEYDSIPKLESFGRVLNDIRPCFQGMYNDRVETDSGQGWVFMSAAAAELMSVGATLEHVHKYFSVQKQYNESITNKHMKPIMKKSLSPYRCVKLQEECSNYVLNYCNDCPIMKQNDLCNEIKDTVDRSKKKESSDIKKTLEQFDGVALKVKDLMSDNNYNMIISDFNGGKKWAIVSFLEKMVHEEGARINMITNLLETKNILITRLKAAGVNFLDNPSNLDLCPYKEKYEKIGYVPSIICKQCDKYVKIKSLVQPLTADYIEMSDEPIYGDISFYERLAEEYETCPKWVYMALLIGTVNEPMVLLMTDAKIKHHLFIPGSPLLPVLKSDLLACTVIDQIDSVSREVPKKTITQREISNHMRELDIIDLNELEDIEKDIDDLLALGDKTMPVLKKIVALEYLKIFVHLEKLFDTGKMRKVSIPTEDNYSWYYDFMSDKEFNIILNDVITKKANPRLYDSLIKYFQELKIECNAPDGKIYAPKSFREIMEEESGNDNILGITSTPGEIEKMGNKWLKSYGNIDTAMFDRIYGIPMGVNIKGTAAMGQTVIFSRKDDEPDDLYNFKFYRDSERTVSDLVQLCRGNMGKGLKTYYQYIVSDILKAAKKAGANEIFVPNGNLFKSLGFTVIDDPEKIKRLKMKNR